MQSYNYPRAMSTHGDTYMNRPMSAGPQYRSESRNFNPGSGYPGDQRSQHFLQRRPSNYTLGRQAFDDEDEDLENCRPRGSILGEPDQYNFAANRRRASFGGNLGGNNMYGSAYGMGLMSSSPREQMMRAQMMRGDLYSMDPMMGRMGLGGGYGGMYGGMSGYGVGPSMYGAGSAYGGGMMARPCSMMGMGPMGVGPMGMGIGGVGMGMGMGMGMYGRPYRMSGLVDTPSPHLTRAKTWSAYGRLY